MKKAGLLILLFLSGFSLAQEVYKFSPVAPAVPTQLFRFPCNIDVQVLAQEGDVLNGYPYRAGTDFTAFVSSSGSSTSGYLSVNHESTPGHVSTHKVEYDSTSRSWILSSSKYVNFADVVSLSRPCSGGITPWGTVVASEESVTAGDANNDGYQDVGWHVEINPVKAEVIDHNGDGKGDKLWALGRMIHENICFRNDSITAYFGADDVSNGFLYKFISFNKADLSSGKLYVLKMGTINDTTGTWVQVPNTTAADQNNTIALSQQAGAYNFKRIEDVEIGINGEVYFVSTITGVVYRFIDNGNKISRFTHYVGNMTYSVPTPTGNVSVAWGTGQDNLTVDNQGNLWVLQDGGYFYIWFVANGHTQQDPKVSIFAAAPGGAEPTGMTFSPDNKFMFLSLQHPSTANSTPFTDVTGRTIVYDRATTLVMARKEVFGDIPSAGITFPARICEEESSVQLTATPAGGTFSGTGISGNMFDPAVAGSGYHEITYTYNDSAGCQLETKSTLFVEVCTSVNEQTGLRLTASPNPSDGRIFLNRIIEEKIEIFDSSGRRTNFQKNQKYNGTELIIDKPGVFIISTVNGYVKAVVFREMQ